MPAWLPTKKQGPDKQNLALNSDVNLFSCLQVNLRSHDRIQTVLTVTMTCIFRADSDGARGSPATEMKRFSHYFLL